MQPYTTGKVTSVTALGMSDCRILCLDVGDRYVGVALSEMSNRIARPLTTIYRREDVARPESLSKPTSPNSYHSKKYDGPRKQTDLRTRHSSGVVVQRPIKKVMAELKELVIEHHCVAIVVGMPLTLQFKMDIQCTKTIEFVQQIRHAFAQTEQNKQHRPASPSASDTSIKNKNTTPAKPFVQPMFLWWDERLSSSDARNQLSARGLTGRKLAVSTDSFAAATILQEFLNRLHLT